MKWLIPKALRAHRKRARIRRRYQRALLQREGLQWHRGRPCPVGLYDHAAARIGKRFYIAGGYTQLSEVCSVIHVFDLDRERWVKTIRQPKDMPQSHCGMHGDGERYLYFVAGQLGAQCSPAVDHAYSYDTRKRRWHKLPPLPEPRYAGTLRLWRGRLHFIGGAKEDRWTPSSAHWSLAVKDGQAVETGWTRHAPIPLPAMHRGSIIVDDRLYVMGGQQGDFMAMEGATDYRCTAATPETYFADCYRLDEPNGDWTRLADMQIPLSHNDFNVDFHEGRILVTGGQIYKDPGDHHLALTDVVQAYDIATDSWQVAGHLPHPAKTMATTVWNGQLTAVGGQIAPPESDFPGPIAADVWKTSLDALAPAAPKATGPLRGRTILLLTHELSRTGAPMLLLEAAQMLLDAGATLRIASLADEHIHWPLRYRARLPLVPARAIDTYVETADIIVGNTVTPQMTARLDAIRSAFPEAAERIVQWVHEIDTDAYPDGREAIRKASMAIFDSDACRAAWADVLGELPGAVVIHPAVNAPLLEDLRRERAPVDDLRRDLGVEPEDFLVLCIGTVEARKGQRLLLKTLARTAAEEELPIRLCLVGFLHEQQREEFLASLTPQEQAVLTPERALTGRDDITDFYRIADAFVMNSQGVNGDRGECFGRVTIEAMAAGTPVLGTAAGGTLEIIEHDVSGYLYPVGEEGQSDLARQIAHLVRTPEDAARLAAAGRQRAMAVFHPSRLAEELEAALVKMPAAQRRRSTSHLSRPAPLYAIDPAGETFADDR